MALSEILCSTAPLIVKIGSHSEVPPGTPGPSFEVVPVRAGPPSDVHAHTSAITSGFGNLLRKCVLTSFWTAVGSESQMAKRDSVLHDVGIPRNKPRGFPD